MKAILKEFYSPDIDVSLSSYVPTSLNNFGFLARLIVGEEKLGGEESFDVMICTPQWLISNHNKSDIIIGRHHLIVFEYDYQRIFSKIKSQIEQFEFSTWDEIGLVVGRIGKWEFEDYKE
jgi:Immunity protein 8